MMNTSEQKTSYFRTSIDDVKVVRMQTIVESRGKLVIGEWSKQMPFEPKRFFVVSQVPPQEIRANHGHREQHQFLVSLQGVSMLLVDDGSRCKAMVLNCPESGVYIPPLIWTQYTCSADSILLVLSSDLYDPDDYVYDYSEFVGLKVGKHRAIPSIETS